MLRFSVRQRDPPNDTMQDNASTVAAVAKPGFTDYVLLFLISAIWGSSFLFIKIGVTDLPAVPFTTLRLALGAAVMLALAWYTREKVFGIGLPWPTIWFSGLLGNALPFVLIGWGEERIDSGLAAILMAVAPLATVVLAHIYTHDDRLTFGKVAGVVLGTFGILVLMGPSRLADLGGETLRQAAVAVAAVCYAANVIITRKIQRTGASPTTLVTAVILVSAVIMLPVQLLWSSTAPMTITTSAFASAAVMAVFHTAAGTVLMFVLIDRQGPSYFSQVNFLVPIFGVLWGVLVLTERPGWNALLALLLILAGMAVARRRNA